MKFLIPTLLFFFASPSTFGMIVDFGPSFGSVLVNLKWEKRSQVINHL